VNPRSGHEAELEPLKKDGEGRKVVVVGAGPAGMEAAHALYERGFKPIIFEAKSEVGGQVQYANKPPAKDKLDWLIGFQRTFLEKHGIEVRLDTPATVENLKAEEPYAVIWAAGALPVKPGSIPGIDLDCVVTPPEVLSGAVQFYGKNICVVGSGMTGIETAEYLADKGNHVDVYEMVENIGPGMHFQNLIDVLGRLMPTGAGLFPCHKLVEIRDGEADFEKTDTGEKVTAKFDYLVLSLGTRGVAVPEDIKAAFPDIIAVGDAEKAGRIQHATYTGYMAAYNLKYFGNLGPKAQSFRPIKLIERSAEYEDQGSSHRGPGCPVQGRRARACRAPRGRDSGQDRSFRFVRHRRACPSGPLPRPDAHRARP
jgi:NADPH-dependent 2,4-dienoyl-CoA reductase/sulfur reductase-like enzyme